MRISIRTKLAAAIILPLLATTAAIVAVNGKREMRLAVQVLESQVVARAEAFAGRLDEVFKGAARGAEQAAVFVAQDQDLLESEVYAAARAAVEINPLVFGSCVAFEPFGFSPSIRLFAPYVCRESGGSAGALRTMDVGKEGYDYTQERWEWYGVPMRTGKGGWTEPYLDDGAGNVVMCTYSAPFERRGKRGVATVDVRLEDIHTLELEGALPGEELTIISRTGTILSFPDRAVIMKWSLFKIAERFSRPDVAELGRKMTSGERGVLRLADLESPSRTDLVAFAPIRSTGWSLYTSIDESQVLAPVYRHMWMQALTGMVGVTVAVAVLLYVSVRITRPIRRLSAAVAELGQGNLNARAESVDMSDEVGELARAFNAMVDQLRAQVKELTRATAQRETVETELRVARQIQLSLLPRAFPKRDGVEVYGISEPARFVGGDFFDCFELPDGRMALVIADVSGKGVPAAMLMAVARTMIRELLAGGKSPAETMTTVNDVLAEDNENGMFVTAFVGLYDANSGVLLYANAGHPYPVLIGPNGASLFGETTGTVLGAAAGMTFDDRLDTIPAGGTLVWYTDGVTEARSPSGAMFGEGALLEMLRGEVPRGASGASSMVIERVRKYQHETLADDLTVMVLARVSVRAAAG